jgi:hypothetical protein
MGKKELVLATPSFQSHHTQETSALWNCQVTRSFSGFLHLLNTGYTKAAEILDRVGH